MRRSFNKLFTTLLVFVASSIAAISTLAQQPNCYRSDMDTLKWVHFYNGALEKIVNVAYSDDGSLYVVGKFNQSNPLFDSVRICPVDLPRQIGVFVAKYDTNLELNWIKCVSSGPASLGARFPTMTVHDNKVYLNFDISIRFDRINQPSVCPAEYVYFFDTFYRKPYGEAWQGYFPPPLDTIIHQNIIVVLDAEGNIEKMRTVVQRVNLEELDDPIYANLPWVETKAMTCDSAGNLYVVASTASFKHNVFDLDRGTTQHYVIDVDSVTVAKRAPAINYIFKFDKDLRIIWAKPQYDSVSGCTIKDSYADVCPSLLTDEEGNLYALYEAQPSSHIGTGGRIWLDSTHVINGSEEQYYYIVKYSPDGDILWCNQSHYIEPLEDDMMSIDYYGSYCSAALDGDRMFVSLNRVFRFTPRTGTRPNFFFDPEHQHPLVFSHEHQGVMVEYDTRTGVYLRHDTIPAYEGAMGGTELFMHPHYLVTGVNVMHAHRSGYHYHIRRNRQTGDIYYGNPAPRNDYTAYTYAASPYGHVCVKFSEGFRIKYDSILDTRLRPVAPDDTTHPESILEPSAPHTPITLRPNPASTEVTIEGYEGEVQIVDLQGRVVDSFTNHSPLTTHHLQLPPGTYLVKCGTTIKKLVVQ